MMGRRKAPPVSDSGNAELFRAIVRSTTDGLWIFDDAGITIFANDRLAEILGRTTEEMQGLPVSEPLDAVGRQQFVQYLDDLHSHGASRENVDCNLIRKDGSRIWALVSDSPLLDDDGVRRAWLHRVTELTDRKQFVDKLVSSEHQLAEAQSVAGVGSWEWDVPNDVVTWSDQLYRIYNLQPQEFTPTYEGFLAHVHPEDRAAVEAAVSSAFTEAQTFEFDARIVKQGGDEGWIRGRGRVIRDGSGAPVRMNGTAHEITESVLAAQELAAARDAAMAGSRMKSDFLATMSHEIRTPLNGVIGLTGLLLRTDLDAAQQRLATGVSQAGVTLLGLINDILDFSKIEAGKLELELVDFDVRDVVDQVVALMAESAGLKSVELVVVCHADVPRTLRGDPGRFGQILTNLVSNAVKFTADGQVTVLVDREDGNVGSPTLRVEVRDTGTGIPADVQPRLFEAFTQADASTTREFGGTGLGLTISRRLVEALGGEIGFESEIGVGSRFWFTATFGETPSEPSTESRRTITASNGAPTSVAHAPSARATPSLRGTVLVAEDNVVNQMVARGMLEGLGYGVEFAQDGLEAVAAVTASPDRFVCVLMDVRMPLLDGYAATRAIRQHECPGERVPIIAMTASAVLGDKELCVEAGMDDFLVKPVGFELLESTLAHWIDGTPASIPASGAEDFGVLDLNRIQMLQDLRSGDRSLFDQFVATFLERVPEDVHAIEAAVRGVDHVQLVDTAHRLKGSAQNLGAVEVGRVCQALEAAGERLDITDAVALIPVLAEQVERASYALTGLVSAGRGGDSF
jgi:PAS domain S-box-containing protein